MDEKIKVAINGYGNLGRAVEAAVQASPDMEAVVVFTRRDPATVQTAGTPVKDMAAMPAYVDQVDVCICCGGSATDLQVQGPEALQWFNTVDSFDNHGRIPEYFEKMDATARGYRRAALISSGWDPGLFSINRVIADAILPAGETYTFWGRGVSQGHSDAIRRIPGVAGAVQYTVPVEEVKARIMGGEHPQLTTRDKHLRQCLVVAAEDADKVEIERAIVTMPNYFADYDTTVEFISAEELARDHSGMPHGGDVIRLGQTSAGVNQVYAFHLALDSNPGFTGAAVTAYARALARIAKAGGQGAYTVFDVSPAQLSPRSPAELRRTQL